MSSAETLRRRRFTPRPNRQSTNRLPSENGKQGRKPSHRFENYLPPDPALEDVHTPLSWGVDVLLHAASHFEDTEDPIPIAVVEDEPDNPYAVGLTAPAPGWNLWSALDLHRASHDTDDTLIRPLILHALRPAEEKDAPVYPLRLLHAAGLMKSQVVDAANLLRDTGWLPQSCTKEGVIASMKLFPHYGPATQEVVLAPSTPHTPLEAPRNSSRTPYQHWALENFSPEDGPLFSQYLHNDKVVHALSAELEERVAETLADNPDLTEGLHPDVVRATLNLTLPKKWFAEPWDFSAYYDKQRPADERLVAGLIRQSYKSDLKRYKDKAKLGMGAIALSLITGISPTHIVRANLHALRHTGIDFISTHAQLHFVDHLKQLDFRNPNVTRRVHALATQLEGIAEETVKVGKSLEVQLLKDEAREIAYGSAGKVPR